MKEYHQTSKDSHQKQKQFAQPQWQAQGIRAISAPTRKRVLNSELAVCHLSQPTLDVSATILIFSDISRVLDYIFCTILIFITWYTGFLLEKNYTNMRVCTCMRAHTHTHTYTHSHADLLLKNEGNLSPESSVIFPGDRHTDLLLLLTLGSPLCMRCRKTSPANRLGSNNYHF